MTRCKDDGGTAFPMPPYNPGMSLLDWFAANSHPTEQEIMALARARYVMGCMGGDVSTDEREMAAILTALRSAGLAIVPREPDIKTIAAGRNMLAGVAAGRLGRELARDVYDAMIATAEGK